MKEKSRNVILWFFVLAGLLTVSCIFIYQMGFLAIQANQKIESRILTMNELANFFSLLKDAETGQRGFLLTGEASYLEPYQQSLDKIKVKENELRSLAASGDLPSTNVERTIALAEEKLTELEQTIQLRGQGLAPALAGMRTNRGKQTMDEIRAEIGRMQSVEQDQFIRERQQMNSAAEIRTATFLGTGLVNLVALAWVFRVLFREVLRRQAIVLEITAQKELLGTTLASIGDAVIVTDAEGQVTFLNAEAERLTGWKTAEASGEFLPVVFKIVNEKTRQIVKNPVEKVLEFGKVVGLANHTILISKDGREIPIDDSAAPIREPAGPISGVVLVFRDCAEQRKSALISARLSAIIEHSGDAIISKNLDGVIQTWNVGAERLLGYRPEEIIGKSILTIIPPERHPEEKEILGRIRNGKVMERFETIRLTKDGRRIHVSITASPLKNSDGEIIGASKIMRDFTDIMVAQEALTQEKELLGTTLASIGDAVIVTDAEGQVTFLNAEAERLTGWKTDEARGQSLPVIFKIINEMTRLPVENPVEKVLQSGKVVGLANHTILISKGGREIPIDDSAAPIRGAGEPVFGVVLVFRDFTRQREAQGILTRSKEELEVLITERTAKLQEMVDELQHISYAMAHDMRAPLRAMNIFAERLLQNESGNISTEGRDYLKRIIVAGNRFDQLIKDALYYTKAVQLELPLEAVDLSKLMRGLIETYPNLHPNGADINIEGELPAVIGNDAFLTQCFSNLLGNAVKFVAPGVKPKVCITAEVRDSVAKIWIKDNGIGIPKQAQRRLFKMFQKLDDKYEGTGIGLAVVRKVVERMAGKVGVESEAGTGSNFWVELRLASANARD